MHENDISSRIIEAAIEVHRELGGPGLLERVYEEAICWELEQQDLDVKQQVDVPIAYKGHALPSNLRLDLLVEDDVILECKATTEMADIFQSQVLTYLRMTDRNLGLLINFGEKYVKDGIHRIVNDL